MLKTLHADQWLSLKLFPIAVPLALLRYAGLLAVFSSAPLLKAFAHAVPSAWNPSPT